MAHPILTIELAKQIRLHVLRMVYAARASHLSSCFSIADILAVLYGKIMHYNPENPDDSERDRFILSKGHAGAAVYAVLAESNFFPKEWLATYCQNESRLLGHLTKTVPGVEISTGSLGHGLSIAVGMALAGKRDGKKYHVYVVLSDGECNEGSVWEAIMFAAQHQLDNLMIIIDYNKFQGLDTVKNVIDLEPFAKKWEAFNWIVREINGHDHAELEKTLNHIPFTQGKPSVIIAHTIKGKGVSFMENQLVWHYKSPNDQQFTEACHELEHGIQI